LNIKKIKILGSGPTGSLLALTIASEKCKVVLVDPLTDVELSSRDKGYAITQSSRKIFEEFKLWDELNKFTYGFDSLSIVDSEIAQSVIIRTNDLKKTNKTQTNIGWVIEHKYLMKILIDYVNGNKNIERLYYDSTENEDFDFILAADGRDSSSRSNWKIKYLKRIYNQRCISFRAILKELPHRRAYEIFRHEGPLALLPLGDNIYQVIWFSENSNTQLKLKLSKEELLKSLEKLLPDNIKPLEIVSEISTYSVAQAFTLPKLNLFKNILVGDAAHSFHPVGGQGLNSCIRDVYEMGIMIKNYENKSQFKKKVFSLIYYLNRFIDIFSLVLFTDFLIKLFSNKFVILYPFRALIFYLMRKIKFVRTNVFSLMTDSIKKYKFNK
tara:strand:- start:8059 stop:9207 length:1149 start_codon:yes stop_codon:yes gene_type:complete